MISNKEKPNPTTRWAWAAGLAVILMLAWTFVSLKHGRHPGHSDDADSGDRLKNLAIRLKNTEVSIWNDGEKTWRFKAGTIDIEKTKRKAIFKGTTRGEMLDGKKKVASVSASEVTFDMFTSNVSIPDVLDFRVVDGPSIKAKNIYWNPTKSKLFCEGGVTANLPVGAVQGDKMTVDIANKEVTVQKIRGAIDLDELP